MRVYLDNCCYNRPFDEQTQLKVLLETEAKLRVQSLMRNGDVEYVWSGVLDYEIRGGQSRGLRDGGSVMKAMTDNELLTICFDALVERVGYVGTERFIAVMNREPEDYTRWRENQPDEEESIEELGAKIMELESTNEELVNA